MGWLKTLYCLAALLAYLVIPMIIFVRHNSNLPIRQVFVFHPLANAGGGGEKCLWAVLRAAVDRYTSVDRRVKPLRIVLFTRSMTPHVRTLLADVQRHFDISFPSHQDPSGPVTESRDTTRLTSTVTLRLVRLHSACLLFDNYPLATQLLQLAAGGIVALEAALKTKGNRKDVVWDTTGLASTVRQSRH